MCYARYLLLAVIMALSLGQMLSACGQKGPLYHPEVPRDSGESN